MDRRLLQWRIPKLCHARNWLLEHMPAGLLARPGEWFLAIICFPVGLTILTGIAEPTSVARLLPRPIFIIWGACLVIGGASLTCGLSSYRRAPGGWIVTRVPCYRLGLRLLALSAALYTFCLIWYGHVNAVPNASILFAFALMCCVRLLTLGNRG